MTRGLRRLLAAMPGAAAARGFVRHHMLADRTRRRRFAEVYAQNYWRGDESLSGRGSSLAQTAPLRAALPALCHDLGARSLLDVPCGDFHWMQAVDLAGIAYTGADIVPALVAENKRRYQRPDRRFVVLDLVTAVPPQADLVLCRDLLVHLPWREIVRALRNIRRSGATWVLTTSFTARPANEDLAGRDWRPLNLQCPPFGLPPPLRLIDEQCSEDGGMYADKSLGLWRCADLP